MRSENCRDQSLDTYIEKNVPCTFQYIPILDTLKMLVTENVHIVKKNVYDSRLINIGSYLEQNILYQNKKCFLSIQIYFDEFETVNPLGSKTGSNKMGAFYFTIKNINRYYNSHLNHIHLLALFFTVDLKKHNLDLNVILKPIIQDIKILESEGIFIEKLDDRVFGTITSLSHDNLGANSLNGMVESFQANYYCRICLTNKNDAQNIFTDSETIIKTFTLSEFHANNATEDKNCFGIRRSMIFNELKYFKLFDRHNARYS